MRIVSGTSGLAARGARGGHEGTRDCLLLVDLFTDFGHEDGRALLESLRDRACALEAAVRRARSLEMPIVYANDNFGHWDGRADRIVGRALAGPGGTHLRPLQPAAEDRFVVKPRYSAFDSTPLQLVLAALEIERVLLCGMATEACVTQTAIGARELGFQVTVLADACASADPELERVALAYLEGVVGARVERSVLASAGGRG